MFRFVFQPIIAFGFGSIWLLWGLTLGAIPVVIHLLHKRRFRESQWAAMRFLLEAAKKNSRRIRLEQLLLLIVRTLIFVLLVTALSQPHVESFGITSMTTVKTHRIVVIDASYSMAYRSADNSLFERAKDIAKEVIAGAGQGDALNLVRICSFEPRVVVREPSFHKRELVTEIDRMMQTDERGDTLTTLREVVELLKEAPSIEQKQVTIISDFQRASWSPESVGGIAEMQQLLRTLSGSAELVLVDVGKAEAGNTAVSSLIAEEPFVVVGRPIHLQATIRQFGRSVLGGQVVKLYVDERLAETRTVTPSANGDLHANFIHTFSTSGEHQVEARIDGDSLDTDNRRWLALPVKEELKVLLVNGRRSGRPAENATFYLEKTFSPSTSRKKWTGITKVTTIDDGELTTRDDLSRYDCIFLCNVATFEPREAGILHAYLEGGGGVVFCLGDQVRQESYNRQLFRDGEGILPAKLGDRVGNATVPESAFGFDVANLDHPIVRAFVGNPGTGLESALTFEYVGTEPRGDASVALRFSSGDPAIIDAPVGRGRVLLISTAVDTRWGAWPVQRSFPPLMHEIVHYAVTGRWEERQRLVGEPLTRVFPVRAFTMQAKVNRPDNRTVIVRLTESEQFANLAFRQTDRRGLYEVELGVPLNRSELFALNVDPRESDLSKASESDLKTELFPGTDFTYLTKWREFRRRDQAAVTDRGGLTRWLLAATFCLIIVEQMMAWKFYRGFLLLYCMVALAFIQQVSIQSTAWAVLLTLLLAAGLAALIYLGRRKSHTV
ncbi:MAG: VWA domain-containing protein [Planctomycetaceae bacterium]|jgi:hypothetical protein|nr:VWA domain-containing protein [Planctomycetaceae bacterium]MBT6485674.1 VWA domain-containing protein [Planctomycetaceae bacterium]MBT6497717.1 VWA domain-containing protein [Planctomycetaceae bacterium]